MLLTGTAATNEPTKLVPLGSPHLRLDTQRHSKSQRGHLVPSRSKRFLIVLSAESRCSFK